MYTDEKKITDTNKTAEASETYLRVNGDEHPVMCFPEVADRTITLITERDLCAVPNKDENKFFHERND